MRMLTGTQAPGDRPILVQHGGEPVIRGIQADGADQRCPNCRKSVILAQVVDGEVFDLAFECGMCRAIAIAPSFPAGRGLGGVHFRVPPGRHTVWPASANPFERRPATTMENDHGAIIVGPSAVLQRARETGTTPPGQSDRAATRVEMTARFIRELLDRARHLFADFLPGEEARLRRGLRHVATPPRNPHALAELTVGLERNLDDLEKGGRDVDVASVLDLHRALDLYERWREDPAFPALLAAAKSSFRHDVILLAAASVLADSGLGPEFHFDTGRRAADLRIVVALRRAFMVEVKAPDVPFRPADEGASTSLRQVVRNCFDSAEDQLEGPSPGVLVIGGRFIASSTLDTLVDETRKFWEEKGTRRTHLAAALIVTTSLTYQRRAETAALPFDWSHIDFTPGLTPRWIPNPHYASDLTLTFPERFDGPYDIAFKP
jgi:hypothetical protein